MLRLTPGSRSVAPGTLSHAILILAGEHLSDSVYPGSVEIVFEMCKAILFVIAIIILLLES